MSPLVLYGVSARVDDAEEALPLGTAQVAFRDVAAVVESFPAGAPAPPLARYRGVVEFVFGREAILPAPPGTVFQSHDVLAQWLELHYFTLADGLAFVADRAVARVRVAAGEPAAVAAEIDGPASPPTGAPGALETMRADCVRVLRRHAVAVVTLPPGDDGDAGTALSFLVERERWDVFLSVLRQEARRHPALALRLTGPWPPYDFVRMEFGG